MNLIECFTPELVLLAGLLLLLICCRQEGVSGWAMVFFTLTLFLSFKWRMRSECSLPFFSIGDSLQVTLKTVGLGIAFLSGWLAYQTTPRPKNEVYPMILASLLGYNMTLMSQHLFMLYLSLELMTLPILGLMALSSYPLRVEAALKYLLQSSLIGSVFLLGLAFLMMLDIPLDGLLEPIATVAPEEMNLASLAGALGLCLMLFKLGIAPFHFWVPDIYQESASYALLMNGVLTKVALFHALHQLFLSSAFAQFIPFLSTLLMISFLLTTFIGHFGALVQTSFQRLLGYSAMTQNALLLAFLIEGSPKSLAFGYSSLIAYGIALVGLLLLMVRLRSDIDLSRLTGLMSTHPILGMTVFSSLLSFLGMPPLIGFFIKFFAIEALLNSQSLWVAIIFVALSVVSIGYYAPIITSLFYPSQQNKETAILLPYSLIHLLLMFCSVAAIWVLGISPQPLIGYFLELCQKI